MWRRLRYLVLMGYFVHEVDSISACHMLLVLRCGLLLLCRSLVVEADLGAVEWIYMVLGDSLLGGIPLRCLGSPFDDLVLLIA